MTKILIAECKQEISSFNPVPSHYSDFAITQGESIFQYHRGRHSEIAAALGVFEERPEIELVPTYSARALTSGGTLVRADFDRLAGEFLAQIRAAPPVDGIYFSLHGAMAAEGVDDPEGYLLEETRKIVGEEVPLVASFDLHGIITERILSHCDAITVFHTYPHVDMDDTGYRAARLLLQIMDGTVKPVTALVPIPAIVRGYQLITATGLFGKSIRAAQAIEATDDGLAAGMFIGNPFTDVLNLRSNSFVITNNDVERAKAEAIRMAEDFWAVHEQLQEPLVTLEEAIAQANQATGSVIFVDAADATSSGASGDSNAILRGLVESGYTGSALLPIVDPEAVDMAMQAGVGNEIETTVGGKLDSGRYTPLPIKARVHMLSEGRFPSESSGVPWYSCPTAVLQSGNFTIIATSRPVSLFDRSLFYAHGQDPKRFDLIVVKSPHCQPHFFDEWAEQSINVDVPGSTSANLKSLGHTVCRRPIFPLDENVLFTPEAIVFQRG